MLAAAFPVTPFRAPGLPSRALDILIIATLIYYLLRLLRGTRAVQMLVAIGLLAVSYWGARWARLEMVEWLLTTLLPYVAIALIILFQPEIRRALSRVGRNLSMMRLPRHNPKATYEDIVMAAEIFLPESNRRADRCRAPGGAENLYRKRNSPGRQTFLRFAGLDFPSGLAVARRRGDHRRFARRGRRMFFAAFAEPDDFQAAGNAASRGHRNHRR